MTEILTPLLTATNITSPSWTVLMPFHTQGIAELQTSNILTTRDDYATRLWNLLQQHTPLMLENTAVIQYSNKDHFFFTEMPEKTDVIIIHYNMYSNPGLPGGSMYIDIIDPHTGYIYIQNNLTRQGGVVSVPPDIDWLQYVTPPPTFNTGWTGGLQSCGFLTQVLHTITSYITGLKFKEKIDGQVNIEGIIDQSNSFVIQVRDKRRRSGSNNMVYKIACHKDQQVIVKMELLPDSLLANGGDSKYRTNVVRTVAIARITPDGYIYDIGEAWSSYDRNFKYFLGEISYVDNFERDLKKVCVPGLHFFWNQFSALDYGGVRVGTDKFYDINEMNNREYQSPQIPHEPHATPKKHK